MHIHIFFCFFFCFLNSWIVILLMNYVLWCTNSKHVEIKTNITYINVCLIWRIHMHCHKTDISLHQSCITIKLNSILIPHPAATAAVNVYVSVCVCVHFQTNRAVRSNHVWLWGKCKSSANFSFCGICAWFSNPDKSQLSAIITLALVQHFNVLYICDVCLCLFVCLSFFFSFFFFTL